MEVRRQRGFAFGGGCFEIFSLETLRKPWGPSTLVTVLEKERQGAWVAPSAGRPSLDLS